MLGTIKTGQWISDQIFVTGRRNSTQKGTKEWVSKINDKINAFLKTIFNVSIKSWTNFTFFGEDRNM